jgi:isoleucyl-tRNA synthetase
MNDKYESTLNLPQTNFQMKAGLVLREPTYIALWNDKYYSNTLKQWRKRPVFRLLDGPPYANGDIHIGHAYNKILKDTINRSRALSGYSVELIPGWDCHGLPIENKIKRIHTDTPTNEWLHECRTYAQEQVNQQREDFKKLGIFASWNDPYLTMSKYYEANIIRVFGNVWKNGYVYSDLKPVHWCAKCQSPLSLAELEYIDSSYRSIYFKQLLIIEDNIVLSNKLNVLMHPNTSLVIWTTTPWTISENQALAISRDMTYVYLASETEAWIVSETFANTFKHIPVDMKHRVSFKGTELVGLNTYRPLSSGTSTVYAGDFVIDKDIATGIVHISPAHGEDDHNLAKRYGIPTDTRVTPAGLFSKEHDLFPDRSIYEVDQEVLDLLKDRNALVHSQVDIHSISICWRHKFPIFYLATKQWFINLQHASLHEKVSSLISHLSHTSRNPHIFNNLQHMITGRQEWCISRQRKWGTPIPFFIHKMTGDLHPNTELIIERIATYIEKYNIEGFILTKDFNSLVEDSDHYTWVGDTLDIWFDSGCAASIVYSKNEQVDLVIEGQDQHRGWFQSSLLISLMSDNLPPYNDLISHGFTLDDKNQKMSKSLGNIVTPQEIIAKYGASVLRMYVAGHDWRQDMKISSALVDSYAQRYRKIRNTFRFLLAAINEKEHKPLKTPLVALDKYIIEKTKKLSNDIQQYYQNYEIHHALHSIYEFCVKDISAFYIKLAKYRQYTCAVTSPQYHSIQSTCRFILESLVRALMPIAPFLCHEVLEYMVGSYDIMQLQWSDLEGQMNYEESHQVNWGLLRELAEGSDVAFEQFKGLEKIQKSECMLKITADVVIIDMNHFDLARFFGVAAIKLWDTPGIPSTFTYHKAEGYTKCPRCWIHFKSYKESTVCPSCTDVLAGNPSHCEML